MKNNSHNISTRWLTHVKGEDKEEFTKLVKSSERILVRLSDIINHDMQEQTKVTKKDYETASWAYEQAHLNGMQEAYNNILKLTNHVIKEKE